MRHFLLFAIMHGFLSVTAQSVAEDITGVWLTEDGQAHVEITKADNLFQGKIIWLKEPLNKKGLPWKDDKNPDAKKRGQPILGSIILKGFVFDFSSREYEDGNVYDSRDGKTYSGKMWKDGPNHLKMRGYVGISLFGKTETWTRVKTPITTEASN